MIEPKIRAIYYLLLKKCDSWKLMKLDYQAFYDTACAPYNRTPNNVINNVLADLIAGDQNKRDRWFGLNER